MARKFAILVAVCALTALAVLVLRQQRLLAAAEMTRAVERTQVLERQTWRLRGELMALTSPPRIAQVVRRAEERLGRFAPIEPVRPEDPEEAFATLLVDRRARGGGPW